tara:strand:+ start:145 stop:372 length:228 start_codon:yes stop_codon:yes gene_type:complete
MILITLACSIFSRPRELSHEVEEVSAPLLIFMFLELSIVLTFIFIRPRCQGHHKASPGRSPTLAGPETGDRQFDL